MARDNGQQICAWLSRKLGATLFITARSAAFTLIELLVVACVILILTLASLAGLARARQVAYRVTCMGNLRQVQQSMYQYTMDHQGAMPNYCYTSSIADDGQYSVAINPNWTVQDVGPVATTNILVCPADKKPWKTNNVAASYAYNFVPNLMNWRVLNLSPASTILVFDGNPSAATNSLWWGADGTVGSNGKVTICHKPGTAAEQTKEVPVSALGGHLGHGDYLGPCGGGGSADDAQFISQSGSSNAWLIARRHFNHAQLGYLDGHVETLTVLPSDSLQ